MAEEEISSLEGTTFSKSNSKNRMKKVQHFSLQTKSRSFFIAANEHFSLHKINELDMKEKLSQPHTKFKSANL